MGKNIKNGRLLLEMDFFHILRKNLNDKFSFSIFKINYSSTYFIFNFNGNLIQILTNPRFRFQSCKKVTLPRFLLRRYHEHNSDLLEQLGRGRRMRAWPGKPKIG